MAHRKRTLLPVGIHLGLESVHLVQLEQTNETVELVSKACRDFPPIPATPQAKGAAGEPDPRPEKVKEARFKEGREYARHTIASDGFRGKEVVISLPAEWLVIQYVRLTPMQPEELTAALPWELQGKLPFDPKEAIIRHIVAGAVSEDGETKQDVIALAARRSVVEDHVAAMEKLGLKVCGVGIEPCAMCYPYAFAAMHATATPEGPQNLMLVCLGALATHVAIVRGQDTAFVKDVELGTEHLVEALAKSTGVPLEEARARRATWLSAQQTGPAADEEVVKAYEGIRPELEHFADEIESCMRYHASLARGARVKRLVFLGPEAGDRALVEALRARLGIPCEVGDPLGAAGGAPSGAEPEPQIAVAVGLSLFRAQ